MFERKIPYVVGSPARKLFNIMLLFLLQVIDYSDDEEEARAKSSRKKER